MKHQHNSEGVTLYARICTATGEGMNEGWLFDADLKYFKYEADARAYALELGYKSLDDAYEHDAMYYTEWEIENEMYYYAIDEDGNVEEINHWEDEDDESGEPTKRFNS